MFSKVLSLQPLGPPHGVCGKIQTPFCGLRSPAPTSLVFSPPSLMAVTSLGPPLGPFSPRFSQAATFSVVTSSSLLSRQCECPGVPHWPRCTSRHYPRHPVSFSSCAQNTQITSMDLFSCPLPLTGQHMPEVGTSTVVFPPGPGCLAQETLHTYLLEGSEGSEPGSGKG